MLGIFYTLCFISLKFWLLNYINLKQTKLNFPNLSAHSSLATMLRPINYFEPGERRHSGGLVSFIFFMTSSNTQVPIPVKSARLAHTRNFYDPERAATTFPVNFRGCLPVVWSSGANKCHKNWSPMGKQGRISSSHRSRHFSGESYFRGSDLWSDA